jgi:hypothetical protein
MPKIYTCKITEYIHDKIKNMLYNMLFQGTTNDKNTQIFVYN